MPLCETFPMYMYIGSKILLLLVRREADILRITSGCVICTLIQEWVCGGEMFPFAHGLLSRDYMCVCTCMHVLTINGMPH